MPILRHLVGFAALLLFSASVHAQGNLTPQTIDRWIAAMEELGPWAEQQGLHEEEFEAGDDEMPDFHDMIDALGKHQAEAERILSGHGFDNLGAWADTSNRILHAYIAMMFEDGAEERGAQQKEMQEQMRRQMREIEQDPNLSDEQKAAIKRQLEQTMAMFDEQGGMFGIDADEADVSAVRARRDVLEAHFNDD